MFRCIRVRAGIVALLLLPSYAHSQDYNAMMQQWQQQDQALTNQMRQMENGIVQGNMQNPQVQQMYQTYISQGGTMTFQQFAYNYAATAGFTPDGMARRNQNERQIQQNDQRALQGYRENQQQNSQWMQQMHQRNSEIAHQRGNLLNGTTDYVDPSTGQRYNLPHTVQPNTQLYDPNSGQGFYNNPQGNYYRQDPNGWDYELQEEQ